MVIIKSVEGFHFLFLLLVVIVNFVFFFAYEMLQFVPSVFAYSKLPVRLVY